MSWDFYKNKKPKARKEYTCELYVNLDMADIILLDRQSKTWSINPNHGFDLTDQELKDIQDYIDNKFKISIGQVHNNTTGMYDGDFVNYRTNIAISNICHRLELFEDV